MAQITLSIADVKKLSEFLTKNSLENFFVAKDQGAYVGASLGEDDNCLFYFKGCDPKKNRLWWEKCHVMFGGDDFGEFLDAKDLHRIAANPTVRTVKIKVTATRITMECYS